MIELEFMIRGDSTSFLRPPPERRLSLFNNALCLRSMPKFTKEFVKEYTAKHRIAEELTKVVNTCLNDNEAAPLARISHELAPLPQPALAPQGRRRMFVGGNWKCKGTRKSIVELVGELNKIGPQVPADTEVVIFPSFLYIDLVSRLLGTPFTVGAQNCWDTAEPGEHTGCVTAQALSDFGVGWVLLGHSDRRNSLGETSSLIGQKTKQALAAGLSVNLTVGETRAQRDAMEYLQALEAQLDPVARELEKQPSDWERVVIAYEPVWAIGEGATPCTPEQAQEVHAHIRTWLAAATSPDIAATTRVVYTGSVTAANCASFIQMPDVDGFVCGRASLTASDLLTVACCRADAAL